MNSPQIPVNRCISLWGRKEPLSDSHGPCVSADGSYVSFSAADGSGNRDVVLVDMREQQPLTCGTGKFVPGHHWDRIPVTGQADKVAYGCKNKNGGDDAPHDIHMVEPSTAKLELLPGTWGDPAHSSEPSISANGRWVTFTHSPDPNHGFGSPSDVHRYDALTGQVDKVNLEDSWVHFHRSQNPSISDDGRLVAFGAHAYGKDGHTWLSNNRSQREVFVHDCVTGENRCISLGHKGVPADNFSELPTISGNGRFVSFSSRSTDMLDGVTPSPGPPYNLHFYVHDMQTGQTKHVAPGSAIPVIERAPELIARSALSATGKYIVIPQDVEGSDHSQMMVHDLETGQSACVSVTGIGGWANGDCLEPAISADGSTIAFTSPATNLGSAEVDPNSVWRRQTANGELQVFVATNPLMEDKLPAWATNSPAEPGVTPPPPPKVVEGDEFVVINGVRVPKRRS